MKLKYLTLGLVLTIVQACTTIDEVVQKPVIEMAPASSPAVMKHAPVKINKEVIFSNKSVIYYPLDKPAGAVQQKFPTYQSVLDNTTAGGYTVFDPSVTVYSLSGASNKPTYLPQYSVPQYAAQYEAERRVEERELEAEAILPLPVIAPRSPVMLTRVEEQEVQPAKAQLKSKVFSPSVHQNENRRSRPVLTSYE